MSRASRLRNARLASAMPDRASIEALQLAAFWFRDAVLAGGEHAATNRPIRVYVDDRTLLSVNIAVSSSTTDFENALPTPIAVRLRGSRLDRYYPLANATIAAGASLNNVEGAWARSCIGRGG